MTARAQAALRPPTLRDVLDAQRQIRPTLARTPFRRYPSLSRLVGADLWVKHENVNPTGAFKVRGGLNLVSRLTEAERSAGVISASTGNHGQSIAYAARHHGVAALIGAPQGANPLKVAGMRDLGAEVILEGPTFDEARARVEQLAGEHGYRYVHSGNEPLLIAGVATYTLEMLEEEPRLDTIIVPVGGGSGAAGALIVAKAVDPAIKVVGVQSKQAPAGYEAWRAGGAARTAPNETITEGLATGTSFSLPQQILRGLDDFVLVDDQDILRATGAMIAGTRMLIEPAGAAAFAAALQLRRTLEGSRVAVVASGGNIAPAQLAEVLALAER